MIKRLLLFVFLLLPLSMFSQTDTTDYNDIKVSILTCADGNQMYAAFGHCAFRVVSESRNIDYVYNYGTFNYKQKSFYIKFVRGFLNYHVSKATYSRFCIEYDRSGREIKEQVLNLTSQERQSMFEYLEWNSLEENKYYKYNFLEDNCATRIRDIIEKICKENVKFSKEQYTESFRDMIHSHLTEMPWFRFGVDLLMGLPVDKIADCRTAMFLPEHVFTTLNNSTITHNGIEEPLVLETNTLLEFEQPVDKSDFFTFLSPSLLFWMMFSLLALITFYEIKRGKLYAIIDRILLFIVGLFGILFVFMWVGTEHTVTVNNLNILWAIPIHIVASFNIKNYSQFWTKYFKVTAVITLIVLLFSALLPQQFDIGFYPLMCILILRLSRLGFCKRY
ncbi:MAG: DUF4105 domain-containing protein [Bacteroidales bacterium]|nr:DUF4105 domain-containing protein [Bacteroidales bacterium]